MSVKYGDIRSVLWLITFHVNPAESIVNLKVFLPREY